MNLERLRKLCLALPGATEQIQWGWFLRSSPRGLRPLSPRSSHDRCEADDYFDAVCFSASNSISIAGPSASSGTNSASPCMDAMAAAGRTAGTKP